MSTTATPKQPQDRKPKRGTAFDDVPEAFEFEHDGETYTFRPTAEHVTPGFLRKHRRDDEIDITYTMIELLADEETLEVIDNMSFPEHSAFQEQFGTYFQKFMGATLGESGRS